MNKEAMDVLDALELLTGWYEQPCTPRDVVLTVAELDHESIEQNVVDGEITDAEIALAFHTVIDALETNAESVLEALEELSCGERH